MSPQELFDTVVNGLRTQGGPGLETRGPHDDRAVCRYRSKDGRKCAIGMLITDEQYVPQMEGTRVVGWNRYCFERVPQFAGHTNLISALQSAHDSHGRYCDNDVWLEQFEHDVRGIALENNLTYTPPTRIT